MVLRVKQLNSDPPARKAAGGNGCVGGADDALLPQAVSFRQMMFFLINLMGACHL